jgi:hypothetical protein
MKTKKAEFYFHGEKLTAYKILQIVSESGSIELEHDVFIQTKEHLTFFDEEEIKILERSVNEDPGDEECIAELEMNKGRTYSDSTYWITNAENKLVKKIKNAKDFEEYLLKNNFLSPK